MLQVAMTSQTATNRPLALLPHVVQAVPFSRAVRPRRHELRSASVPGTVARAGSIHQAAQLVDTVVLQGTPHDSLLKDGSVYMWNLLEQVCQLYVAFTSCFV